MSGESSAFREVEEWYVEGLSLFRDQIDRALETRCDGDEFRELLAWAFRSFDIKQKDLETNLRIFRELLAWAFRSFDIKQKDLETNLRISKSAVSKWVNGQSETTWPTQHAVLDWIRGELDRQLQELMPSRAFGR